MDGIFISYRRDDSAGYAGRLYDRLAAHFGAERVFMDVEGIEPGTDFVDAIEKAVGSCRVLIVLIGDEWASATDAAGRRRLDDPNDFIRLETSAALKRGIRVVPVLVDGTTMPRPESLPEDLHALTRRQAVEISHKQWDASTGELIRTLERILGMPAGKAASGIPATPSPTTSANSAAINTGEAAMSGAAGGTRTPWAVPVGVAAAVLVLGGLLWFSGGTRDPKAPQPAPEKPPPIAETKPAPRAETKPAPGTPAAPEVGAKPAPTPAPSPAAKTEITKPAPPVAAAPAPAPPPPVVAAAPPAVAAKPAPAPAAVLVKPAPRAREAKPEPEVAAPAKETVDTPPAPALAVAPPVAPAPPVAKPAAVSSGGLPRQGESWTYRSSGRWPTSPKRSFQVIVQSVNGDVVTETLRMIDPAGGGEVARTRGGKAEFVAWKDIGIEFSPYLGAIGEIARLETQRGIATPDLDGQWSQWFSRMRLIGQESVTVPAGSFSSHKVEVWSSRHPTGSPIQRVSEPVSVQYYVWYAPEVKRYVKMQRRVISATNNELETEVFELVAR